MRRSKVESSVLDSVGYDANGRVLEVEFRSGKVYEYVGVPRAEHRALLDAESKGKYFNLHIRDRYPYRRRKQ